MRVAGRSRAAALALRPRLRDMVDAVVLPSLGQVFDEVAPGDDVIHLARLELRATVSRLEEVAEVLPDLVRRELAGMLDRRRARGSSRQAAAVPPGRTRAQPIAEAHSPDARTERAQTAAVPAGGARARPIAEVHSPDAGKEHAQTASWPGASSARDAVERAAASRDPAQGAEAGSAQGDDVRAIELYLETGAFPWHVDAEPTIRTLVAGFSIEELARAAVRRAHERSPEGCIAVYFRLLQLAPRSSWASMVREILTGTDEIEQAQTADAIAALAGARGLAQQAQLRAAAVAIASARKAPARSEPPRSVPPQPYADRNGRSGRVELRSMQDDPVHAIEQYLQTGALPRRVDAEAAVQAMIAELAVTKLSMIAAGCVRERSPEASVAVYVRLLRLVPPSSWASIARAILAATSEPDAAAVKAIAGLASAGDLARHPRLRAAAAVLAATRTDRAPRDADRTLGVELARRSPLPARAGWQAGPERSIALPFGIAQPFGIEEPFAIAARYAGLILLHPFLARLFDNTGCKRAGQAALHEAALPRAAALLHACATGEDDAFEYNLAFIKILIGLTPDAPLLVAGGLLSDADRAELDDLLRAVIGHWTVLKKTSPQGLRSTFLCRGGLAREDERAIRVQVEPSGLDVLLAQLPWGIATVKLPWMQRPIFTEWPIP